MQYIQRWWIPSGVVEDRHPVLSRRKHLQGVQEALAFDQRRGVVLQAGGHLGLWPRILARQYQQVYTVEPDPENWACLCKNVAMCDNIVVRHGALGNRGGTASMQRRAHSTGGHYVKESSSGSVPMMRLDDLALPPLDAVFLDVEGYEMQVLLGGEQTIHQSLPLLVCEDNTACTRYGREPGDLAVFLATWGYEAVHRYRSDIVFVAKRG